MSNDIIAGPSTLYNGALIVPDGAKFALVAGRFNTFVVERLIEGAVDALTRHGCPADHITTIRVPGSWEIPTVCARLARSKQFDGIVALGAVIRGGTPHFEYVAAEVTKGIAAIMLETQVPIGFGVLTTDSIEQAIDRAGTKSGNKGFDAALAVIEMVSLGQKLTQAGL
jgi:6,7-dimethyl-8-ribityllumazine synthase